MRSWMAWMALAALPLVTLGSGTAPEPRGPVCEISPFDPQPVLVDVSVDLRPQEPRVTERLIAEAASIGSDSSRARVLIALAQNPTLTTESELRLIEEARKLGSYESRRELLIAVGSTVRITTWSAAPATNASGQ